MSKLDTAFQAIPRWLFVTDVPRERVLEDRPLPIGFHQTNSQPSTVRQMLEWLVVSSGQSVLDVGSGSGWTSALLAYLVGDDGHVTAVERIPELVLRSRFVCERMGLHRVVVHKATTQLGWPAGAPYDRILVSASIDAMPDELVKQLAAPGVMVIPIRNSIHVVHKDKSGEMHVDKHPGYVFVPLIVDQ